MTSRTRTLLPWLLLLAVAGCRGEGDGAPVAQLRAQDRLAADPRPQVTLRRLWAGRDFNFYASSPSPDGRYVTEVDWSTGDLAVRDLTDGRVHRLTDKGEWTESGDYALASVFSAKGDQVAFVWWNGAAQRHELRALRFYIDRSGTPRGSSARVVYSKPAMQPYSIFGWAEDGWILATLRRPDRTNALAMVSPETGELRVLQSFDWRQPGAARSPNGRAIAYDFPASANTSQRNIWLLSDDGLRKTVLVEGTADHVVLGWQPDGSSLLFASQEAGRASVYGVRVVDGATTGPAEAIGTELPGRIEPLGTTGDALYIGVAVETSQLHVAALDDREHGRFRGTESFDDPYGRSIHAWDWSPDGGHIVHDARGRPGSDDFRIVVRSRDGEPVREFRLEGRAEAVRWAADGRTVYLYSWDRAGRPGLRSLDLESGDVRTIRQFNAEWQAMGGQFALSPDGEHLYHRVLEPGAAVTVPTRGSIMRLNLSTEEYAVIRAVRSGGSLALSPDGERLAFVDYDVSTRRYVIRTMPADAGEAREIFRLAAGRTIASLDWTPDGRALVFLDWSPGEETGELRQVDPHDGVATLLADIPDLAFAEPRLHPDGRRIAYRSGRSLGEIWALEGLSPGAAAARITSEEQKEH